MKSTLEQHLQAIQVALAIADWLNIEEHVDYDVDYALGPKTK